MSNVTAQFKFGSAVAGAFVGLEAGILGVVYLACALWPESDLCGLPAGLTAASLGAIAGGALGWRAAPRLRPLVIAFNQKSLEDSRTGDAIRFAMEQRGYTQADLSRVLGSRSRASEIMKGKRLSVAQIRRLHEAWKIPADLLIREAA